MFFKYYFYRMKMIDDEYISGIVRISSTSSPIYALLKASKGREKEIRAVEKFERIK